MDEETKRCQKLVKAIILRSIKDLVSPFGEMNNKKSCRAAFNFILNETSEEYKDFCTWCDLADINQKYWQQTALMYLAYELNFRPWLRRRIALYMKGLENWKTLKKYYCNSRVKEYYKFLEVIENADNN